MKKLISKYSEKCISFELEFEDQFNVDNSDSHNHISTSSHKDRKAQMPHQYPPVAADAGSIQNQNLQIGRDKSVKVLATMRKNSPGEYKVVETINNTKGLEETPSDQQEQSLKSSGENNNQFWKSVKYTYTDDLDM